MAYTSQTPPAVGVPIKRTFAVNTINNLEDHEVRLSVAEGAVVKNGGFEFPVLTASASADPTSWSRATAGGGTAEHIISASRSGKQAWKATVTSGGDSARLISDTDNPVPIAEGQRVGVWFDFIASAAGVDVDVDIFWWYWTGSAFSAASTAQTNIYTSTSNPTSWARRFGSAVAPGGANPAEFFTVRLLVTHAAAGNVIFDHVDAGIFHGALPIVRTSKGTISTDTTTTIDISSQIGGEEAARFVQAGFYLDFSDGAATFTVQGWVGGSWSTILTISGGNDLQVNAEIPLDDSNQFRVVSTGTAGGDSLDVYIGGKYEV